MTISLDAISLPADLQWTDEFAWNPVAQNTDRSLSGAFLVQEAALTYGRPITLEGGAQGAWIERSVLQAVKALADVADSIMTLDYHGTSYSVIFDRANQPVSAEEVQRLADPQATHLYNNLIIRLLTVETP